MEYVAVRLGRGKGIYPLSSLCFFLDKKLTKGDV